MAKLFPPYNEKYIHFTTTKVDLKTFLHVFGAGIVYPDPRYEFTTHFHSTYLFEYIVSGKGFIEVDGKRTQVSEGDTVITKNNIDIHYGADKKEPYVKLWFSVLGRYAEALVEGCIPENEPYIVNKVNTYPFFEKIFSHFEENKKVDIGLVSHAMLDIMLTATGKSTAEKTVQKSNAFNIKQYIDMFLYDDIDIKKVAVRLGISQRSAVKIFSDEYGITPAKYIRKQRLESAKKLLSTTEETVSEIAKALRYCDQSYFSTEFKKEFGVYPSEYRTAVKAKRDEKFIN